MSVTEASRLALLFVQGEDLSSAIANSAWGEGSSFPDLNLSSDHLLLTEVEEKKVKEIVFPEDLHFSVPVNIRDSKNAYLTLISSEEDSDADDGDMLQTWGLDNLYEGPPSPSAAAEDVGDNSDGVSEEPLLAPSLHRQQN